MKTISKKVLLAHFGLNTGSEISLPAGCKLTKKAKNLLLKRHISVRYINASGEVFIEENHKVHPLKLNNIIPENNCILCGSAVTHKPAHMTHLNDHELVPKNHPRISFRGHLDSSICDTVAIQCYFQEKQAPQLVQNILKEIRSYLGQVMQSEVLETPLPLATIHNLPSETVHSWSHQPLKYLGYDHMLPDITYGTKIAKLNCLRAQVRRLELEATTLYTDASYHLSRPDMIAGLNSLSSVIYVLMIMLWQIQRGKEDIIEKLLA